MQQKIKNFISSELSTRTSTYLIILAGIIPIWLLFEALNTLFIYRCDPRPTVGLVFSFYIFFVLSITSVIAFGLFIIENKIESFRLKFKILKSKAFNRIVLFFYILSIICSYVIPSLFLLFNYFNLG